jgi:hypothetical protein
MEMAGFGNDLDHHARTAHWKPTDSRLSRQHQAIRPVGKGIVHVVHFRTCGNRLCHHRFHEIRRYVDLELAWRSE